MKTTTMIHLISRITMIIKQYQVRFIILSSSLLALDFQAHAQTPCFNTNKLSADTVISPNSKVNFAGDTIVTTGKVKAASIETGTINLPSNTLNIGPELQFTGFACLSGHQDIWNDCNGFSFESSAYGSPPICRVGIGFISEPQAALEVLGVAGGLPGLIVGAGNVGIGTEYTDAQLNIHSAASESTSANFFAVTNHTGDVVIIDTTGRIVIGHDIINYGGDSIPNAYGLIDSKGILTTKVKIANPGTSSWSDYVFGINYKLKPLTEVAQYIKENKHLPDVPSAGDVKKDGIDVAQMDATLLKKVEELTLYLIQEQKQSQQQQKEIQDLKTQLEVLKKGQK